MYVLLMLIVAVLLLVALGGGPSGPSPRRRRRAGRPRLATRTTGRCTCWAPPQSCWWAQLGGGGRRAAASGPAGCWSAWPVASCCGSPGCRRSSSRRRTRGPHGRRRPSPADVLNTIPAVAGRQPDVRDHPGARAPRADPAGAVRPPPRCLADRAAVAAQLAGRAPRPRPPPLPDAGGTGRHGERQRLRLPLQLGGLPGARHRRRGGGCQPRWAPGQGGRPRPDVRGRSPDNDRRGPPARSPATWIAERLEAQAQPGDVVLYCPTSWGRRSAGCSVGGRPRPAGGGVPGLALTGPGRLGALRGPLRGEARPRRSRRRPTDGPDPAASGWSGARCTRRRSRPAPVCGRRSSAGDRSSNGSCRTGPRTTSTTVRCCASRPSSARNRER